MNELINNEYVKRMIKLSKVLEDIEVEKAKHPLYPNEQVLVFYDTNNDWDYYYSPNHSQNLKEPYNALLNKASKIYLNNININTMKTEKAYELLIQSIPKVLQETITLIEENNGHKIDNKIFQGLGLYKQKFRSKDKKLEHLNKMLNDFEPEQLPEN